VVVAVAMIATVVASGLQSDSHRSDDAAAAATNCTVTAVLVNPCRPWLGAVADNYPGFATWKDQILGHEARIGKQVDVVHQYHPAGSVTLLSDERYFVDRGSILYLNWRPANVWKDATGTKPTVTAQIDKMAQQIASVAPHKVMLSLFAEPERFVTPGTSACSGLLASASSGSPQDYKDMWAYVQGRFAAAGVTNVVWVMNYLGYFGWDCLFPELWPGNSRVDWITWDPYVGPRERWADIAGYFYNALQAKADATHDYTSKPWGIAEFGYWYGTNQTEAYRMYDDIRAWLDSGNYPRVKLYEPFDMISVGRDTRTSYTTAGVYDPVEQQRYNAFANDPIFDDLAPVDAPTDHLSGCDPTVESGISCFGGIYSGTLAPTLQTTDGHSGSKSVEVRNTTALAGTFGLNVKPAPVSATEVGRTYTGGVWVKASRVGEPLSMILRERRANGTAPANGYTTVTWTSTDTQWHQLTATYTGKEAGNSLTFSVYGAPMVVGDWFRADDFSLSSLPGA
jgi:hypothetical protein